MTTMSNQFKQTKGVRLDEEETKFVEGCLLAVAQQARENNEPKLFNMAMELAQRIRHAKMAGEGIPEELQERMSKGLRRSVESNNPELATRAMENFLATMVRLHPDPAKVLGHYLVQSMNQMVSEAVNSASEEAGTHSAMAIIERYEVKLSQMKDEYDVDGYPAAEDLLQYMIDWTHVGSRQLKKGDDPWHGDDHLERARGNDEDDDDAEYHHH